LHFLSPCLKIPHHGKNRLNGFPIYKQKFTQFSEFSKITKKVRMIFLKILFCLFKGDYYD